MGVLACLSASVGAITTSATASVCPGVTRAGEITRIASPTGRALTTYGVDPSNGRRLFVSDGETIQRSLDGGCSWTVVYSVDKLGSEVADSVTQIVVSAPHHNRRLVYALVQSPCTAEACGPIKLAGRVPGSALLVSEDNGRTWRNSFAVGAIGLPPMDAASVEGVAIAPSDPNYVYLLITPYGYTTEELYRSADAGRTWALQSTSPAWPLAVDPTNANKLWAAEFTNELNSAQSGNVLLHSVDGGVTWQMVPEVSGAISTITVAHRPGKLAKIAVGYSSGGLVQSHDGGRLWAPTIGAPSPVTSLAYGAHGHIVITTGDQGTSAGAPFVYSRGSWRRINGVFRESQVSVLRGRPETYFFNSPSAPLGLLRYTIKGPVVDQGGPVNIQGGAQLGRTEASTRGCARGGRTKGPVEPAPPGTGPIIVDNFLTGCLVELDRFGHARVVTKTPTYSEGIALTFDKQVVITTRFSNILTRTLLPDTAYTVLDANIPHVEGPAFDRYGNLYVVNNDNDNANTVYQYPFPQYPGQSPVPVWTFGPAHFTEDIRIAPPQSPFAGDLFVQYYAEHDNCDMCNPDAIAVLHPTERGWRRLPDFAHFPSNGRGVGIESLGMAFMPDGSLLVPDYTGTGTILRYSPNGKIATTFASVGTNSGQYFFTKIDVAADGYVYVTASGGTSRGPSGDPDLQTSEGGVVGVVRFTPTGRRMLPDFTAGLTFPVGIAVPNVITGLPQILTNPPVTRTPRAVAEVAPPPPPPPIAQPGPAPAAAIPAAAPMAVAAPGAAPAAQAQAQANPVAQPMAGTQAVTVEQEQVRTQVAVALADGAPAAALDHPMTTYRARRNDGPSTSTAAFALFASGAVALACATRMTRSRPQVALARPGLPPQRRRRRRGDRR